MVVAPYRFCVLAPTGEIPFRKIRETLSFRRQSEVEGEYGSLLSAMQYLRGQIYVADGAVSSTALDALGRLCLDDDEQCWHLLLLDGNDELIGCVRYRLYRGRVRFNDLRVPQASLAQHPALSGQVRRAVESELQFARERSLSFLEIGGWALSPLWRHTRAALQILAASYAMGELWGGCIGMATATFRHRSASMLRRLGGRSLEINGQELPPYQDPHYGCLMELLRFGQTPNARFAPIVKEVLTELLSSKVVIGAPVAYPAVA